MPRLTTGVVLICMLVTSGPLVSAAQERDTEVAEHRSIIGVSAEGFVAKTVDRYNAELFGVGGGGALDVELDVHPLLGLQLGGGAVALSRGQSSASTSWFGGRAGLRFHWGVLAGMTSSDGWLDAHANYGVSGGIARAGFDVGLGYGLSLARGFRIGPFVRFGWNSDPGSENPMLLEGGLAIGLLGDPRSDIVVERTSAPNPDRDGDGVLNEADMCPLEPAGAMPEAARPGCPAHDADGDGVLDAVDECPTVPAGARPDAARSGCPQTDTDGDAIADGSDECPRDPAGARPDPRRRGCPDGDRDTDTVWDSADACPEQAGAPSRDAARNGCPGLVRVDQERIQILQPVFFATRRDVILEASYPVLAAVADAIQASGIGHVRVEGHTDSAGNDARNLVLSRRRAESVRRWLVEHGIEEARVTAVGLGETVPFESNDTELGRAANRRVEFHIEQGATP